MALRFFTRCRAATYYTKAKQRKKTSGQAWFLLAGVATGLTGGAVYALGKPEDTIEGLGTTEPAQYNGENVVKAYLLRARDRIIDYKNTFSEPSSEKLLPDVLPPPYQRPYTLVLELNDILIHTAYDRSVGWKYQKRPGVDALLVSLFDYYEIVVFTSEAAMTGNSIMTALDPNQLIMYKLFRDSTKYIDGQHVKDLSALNRSLNRVIVVDTNKNAVKFHPENSIILEKWTGDINDRTLWDLVPFLQTIAVNNVDDTRPVLDYYKRERGESRILDTFQAYQAQLREEEEEWNRQKEAQRRSGIGRISPFSLRKKRAHGFPNPNAPTPPPPVSTTHDVSEKQSFTAVESERLSWTEWIGSWIGWK